MGNDRIDSPVPGAELSIKRIAGSLGAEVHDIDLKRLEGEVVKTLRAALLSHKVLVIRGQALTSTQLLDFAKRVGRPTTYPFLDGVDGHPEIMEVLKTEDEKANFGGVWHADTTYMPEPCMVTVLQAEEVPPVGGDTLFANQVAAYDSLSQGLKDRLLGARCVNTSKKSAGVRTRTTCNDHASSSKASEPITTSHPALCKHPETGKTSLFLNAGHTERFENWTDAESRPLLEYLFQHQVKPEFTCRVRWEPGTVVMWDNFQVQHNPVNDYQGYRRRMLRVTLASD